TPHTRKATTAGSARAPTTCAVAPRSTFRSISTSGGATTDTAPNTAVVIGTGVSSVAGSRSATRPATEAAAPWAAAGLPGRAAALGDDSTWPRSKATAMDTKPASTTDADVDSSIRLANAATAVPTAATTGVTGTRTDTRRTIVLASAAATRPDTPTPHATAGAGRESTHAGASNHRSARVPVSR